MFPDVLECDISSSKTKPVLTQAICGRKPFKDSTNYPRIKQNTEIFSVYTVIGIWEWGLANSFWDHVCTIIQISFRQMNAQ